MKHLICCLSLLWSCSAIWAQNNPEQKLLELGITLPAPSNPVANYVKYVRSGKLIFLSGHGPLRPDNTYLTGKVGKDLTLEQGYEAACLTGINLLGTLKDAVGDLKKSKTDRKSAGHGQLHRHLYRPAQGHQWLQRPDGGCFWGSGPACTLGSGDVHTGQVEYLRTTCSSATKISFSFSTFARLFGNLTERCFV